MAKRYIPGSRWLSDGRHLTWITEQVILGSGKVGVSMHKDGRIDGAAIGDDELWVLLGSQG